MRNLANFLLFQAGWFACVVSAADGHMWIGPVVTLVIVATHVGGFVRPAERPGQLAYIFVVGLVGMLLDSGLRMLGATSYPTSEDVWLAGIAPPWIIALWVLFATLPHHSLRWLSGRPLLACVLGAVGGPLSYLAGLRMGAVGEGEVPLLTWGALAVEYAIVTPLLLHFAPRD